MAARDAAPPQPAADLPPADQSSSAAPALATAILLLRFSTVMAVLCAVAALPASSLLVIRAIEVTGAQQTPVAQIVAAAGLRVGDRRSAHPPARLAASIARLPQIARADVSIAPTGRVRIWVQERRPFAATPSRGAFLALDASGVVIQMQPDAGGLPVVTTAGPPPPWVRLGDRLPQPGVQRALDALRDLPDAVVTAGAQMRAGVSGDLVFVTSDQIRIRLGPQRGLRERALMLPALLQAVRRRGISVEYLDLRFSGSVVMKPLGPADPEGERH